MFKLRYTSTARKQIKRLDPRVAKIIYAWLTKNVHGCEDPRQHSKALVGDKEGIWRYRVGDYRILVEIDDDELVVLAIGIGHRKDIHKR